MQELNCCKEVNFEYESRRRTSQNSTNQLCQPSPTLIVLRIRQLLSIITRKKSDKGKRKKTSL